MRNTIILTLLASFALPSLVFGSSGSLEALIDRVGKNDPKVPAVAQAVIPGIQRPIPDVKPPRVNRRSPTSSRMVRKKRPESSAAPSNTPSGGVPLDPSFVNSNGASINTPPPPPPVQAVPTWVSSKPQHHRHKGEENAQPVFAAASVNPSPSPSAVFVSAKSAAPAPGPSPIVAVVELAMSAAVPSPPDVAPFNDETPQVDLIPPTFPPVDNLPTPTKRHHHHTTPSIIKQGKKRWVIGTAIIQDDTPTAGLPPVGVNVDYLLTDDNMAATPTEVLAAPTFPPGTASPAPPRSDRRKHKSQKAVETAPPVVRRFVWATAIIVEDIAMETPTPIAPPPILEDVTDVKAITQTRVLPKITQVGRKWSWATVIDPQVTGLPANDQKTNVLSSRAHSVATQTSKPTPASFKPSMAPSSNEAKKNVATPAASPSKKKKRFLIPASIAHTPTFIPRVPTPTASVAPVHANPKLAPETIDLEVPDHTESEGGVTLGSIQHRGVAVGAGAGAMGHQRIARWVRAASIIQDGDVAPPPSADTPEVTLVAPTFPARESSSAATTSTSASSSHQSSDKAKLHPTKLVHEAVFSESSRAALLDLPDNPIVTKRGEIEELASSDSMMVRVRRLPRSDAFEVDLETDDLTAH